jgi:hypothetical protein
MSEPNQSEQTPTHGAPHGEPSFFERPSTHKWLFQGLVAVAVLLLGIDVASAAVGFIHRHPHFGFEAWPGFHAVYGFVAYAAIVTSAKGLRRLVKRPEDYYGE